MTPNPHPAAMRAADDLWRHGYIDGKVALRDDVIDLITRHFAPYLEAVKVLREILNGEEADKGLVDGRDWLNAENALAAIDRAEKGE